MSVFDYIMKNAPVRFGAMLINIVMAFVMTPFIINQVGTAVYGLWILVNSVTSYYLLLDFGITTAVAKHLAGHKSVEVDNARDVVTSTGFFIHVSLAVIAFIGSAMIIGFAGYFVDDPVELATIRGALIIYTCVLSSTFLFRTFEGVLRAEMCWNLLALITTSKTVGVATTLFFTLERGDGVMVLAIVNSIFLLLEFLSYMTFALKRFRPRIRLGDFNTQVAKLFMSYGSKIWMNRIGINLCQKLVNFSIAASMGVVSVAVYSIAVQFMNYFATTMASLFGIMTPYYSKLDAEHKTDSVGENLLQAMELSYPVAMLIGLGIMFYGEPFILAWVGPEFLESAKVVQILMLSTILEQGMIACSGFLMGTNNHRILAYSGIVMTALIVGGSYPVLQQFGLVGMAWLVVAINGTTQLFIIPAYAFRKANLKIWRFYAFLGKAFCLHAIPQIAYYLLIRDLLEPTFSSVFGFAFVQGLIALVTLLLPKSALIVERMKKRGQQ